MKSRKRWSLYHTGPKEIAIRQEPLPPVDAQAVLVETEVSAISSGTEMLFYRGQVAEDMAVDATIAGLEDTFSYPLKYGYAAVGRVIDHGAAVSADWLGKRVFVFHPHESHFIVPAAHLHPVPAGLSPESAVFLPFMETAVSFLMDGQPVIGERVVVFGQGVVGLLTTALLSAYPLASLTTVDPMPLRRDWSKRLGATSSLDPEATLDQAHLAAALDSGSYYVGADLVFELSGSPLALDQAISVVGYDGRVVIGSWYGRKEVHLDLGGRFHRSHAQLLSSQVSFIAPRWRGRFDQARRLKVAWSLLARLKPERLISHRFPFSKAAEAFAAIDQNPEATLQVVLTYDREGMS